MELLHHVKRCFHLLTRRGKLIFTLVGLAQCAIAVLDLVGVYLILYIISGSQQLNKSGSDLKLPKLLDNFFTQKDQILLMFVVAVFFFSAKSILAFFLNVIFIRLLGRETKRLINIISESIFINRSDKRLQMTSHDISFTVNESTEVVYMETLSPAIVLISDLFLVTLILLNLLFNARLIFVPSVFYFFAIFIFLRKANSFYTNGVFKLQLEAAILSKSLVQEVYFGIRELTAASKLKSYVSKIQNARQIGVESAENISIARLLPKYVYEIGLFGGIALIAGVSFTFGKAESVLSLVTLFLISASRMIPSFLRIQYYLGIVQKSAAQSDRIFSLFEISLDKPSLKTAILNKQVDDHSAISNPFYSNVSLKNVVFFHSGDNQRASLGDISFEIQEGTSTAIIGASGAGKSTLIDLILGFHHPAKGSVTISGVLPGLAFGMWPGKVAYVPQRITIFNTTLFSNVALSEDLGSVARVERLLAQVGLLEFVQNLPDGVFTIMGELGSRLSGGQIQRIGIARALYSDPSLLILDESTNALDAPSEKMLLNLLLNNEKYTTLIITHNLETIRKVDQIIYLENGSIIAQGKFNNVISEVPNLENQIKVSNAKFKLSGESTE